jgi:ribosomal protein L21E
MPLARRVDATCPHCEDDSDVWKFEKDEPTKTTPASPASVSGRREDRTNSLSSLFSGMQQFSDGDRVRVDIPDETEPDHDEYHGLQGKVMALLEDDAGRTTGEERDSLLFRVELKDGRVEDFRWRDLRPP